MDKTSLLNTTHRAEDGLIIKQIFQLRQPMPLKGTAPDNKIHLEQNQQRLPSATQMVRLEDVNVNVNVTPRADDYTSW